MPLILELLRGYTLAVFLLANLLPTSQNPTSSYHLSKIQLTPLLLTYAKQTENSHSDRSRLRGRVGIAWNVCGYNQG
jgi:hypothetical protein